MYVFWYGGWPRQWLRCDVGPTQSAPPKNLATAIHDLFAPFGGVELDIPPREPMREPPTFD